MYYIRQKLSGSIVNDPNWNQTILAYSRMTGELIGSSVWDADIQNIWIIFTTISDEGVFLTRIDNNGQYFAETYDRLSLYVADFAHGSEYDNVQFIWLSTT